MEERGVRIDLSPSPHAVLDHEVFGHGRGDVDHVVAVGFFGHAGLAVAADGEAEVGVVAGVLRTLGDLWSVFCHGGWLGCR